MTLPVLLFTALLFSINTSLTFCAEAEKESEADQQAAILKLRKKLADGPTDRDRGIALANLIYYPMVWSQEAESRKKALDFLNNEIMPNLHLTKNVEEGNACGWRIALSMCSSIYDKLKDRAGRERCLELMQLPPTDDEQTCFARYLKAFLHAEYGEYTQAISVLENIPKESQYANRREFHINYWKEMQRKKEAQLPPTTSKP